MSRRRLASVCRAIYRRNRRPSSNVVYRVQALPRHVVNASEIAVCHAVRNRRLPHGNASSNVRNGEEPVSPPLASGREREAQAPAAIVNAAGRPSSENQDEA